MPGRAPSPREAFTIEREENVAVLTYPGFRELEAGAAREIAGGDWAAILAAIKSTIKEILPLPGSGGTSEGTVPPDTLADPVYTPTYAGG
jgi:hypothetical protein